jgi:hypothetical protein
MNPTAQDVHVDAILSNMSIAYKNSFYIADGIAPFVDVQKQSDKFYVFTKGDWFRSNAKKRAPGTASDVHGFRLSTSTYFCEEVAIAAKLEDEVRRNQDSVLNLERSKVNFATEQVLLKFEQDVASVCTTTANWGSNYSTPSVLWDNYETSDPIADFETAIEAVEGSTGKKVNKIIISHDVWKVLKHHPQLLERMPSTTMRTATVQVLADILSNGAPITISIGSALVNNEALGATDSFARIWTKDVWVGYVAPNPMIEEPSALYTFVWPENGAIRGVRTWREEKIHSDMYEAFMSYDIKVTGSDLGYLLNNVIS